jgi:hypothetical protein
MAWRKAKDRRLGFLPMLFAFWPIATHDAIVLPLGGQGALAGRRYCSHFRTIQVFAKDLPASLRQTDCRENRLSGPSA